MYFWGDYFVGMTFVCGFVCVGGCCQRERKLFNKICQFKLSWYCETSDIDLQGFVSFQYLLRDCGLEGLLRGSLFHSCFENNRYYRHLKNGTFHFPPQKKIHVADRFCYIKNFLFVINNLSLKLASCEWYFVGDLREGYFACKQAEILGGGTL